MVGRLILLLAALSALLGLPGCDTDKAPPGAETRSEPSVVLRVNTDSIGKLLELNRKLADEFERETGIAVQFVIGPDSSTERLAEYQRFFQAQSADIDIYQLDVIWPGLFAAHLEDLSDVINVSEHFPAAVATWMVDERLVAAPYYSDAPLLYYRTDLLAANGFDDPPRTWKELRAMAAAIQQAERAKGNSGFYGYVFQGAAYEGLTCNALEWQVAETGKSFLSREGVVTLNTPEVRTLFEDATAMVSNLCPPGVLTYKEEESRLVFHQGNAAFMRNWPYAYTLASSEGSPVARRFAVGPLPSGASQSAAVLGGWGLGVSRHSRNKEAAKRFVAFLNTREAQRRRAMEGGYLATRPDVFADPEVHRRVPYFAMMEQILADSVVRPAVPAGRSYNEVSSAYFSAVHLILSKDSSAQRALADAEARIQRILAR